jgi:hypothetical protein
MSPGHGILAADLDLSGQGVSLSSAHLKGTPRDMRKAWKDRRSDIIKYLQRALREAGNSRKEVSAGKINAAEGK